MKIVFGNMYFSVFALEEISEEIKTLYLEALDRLNINFEHNLVKVEKGMESITLLYYPHLHSHAHPYLSKSLKIFLKEDRIGSIIKESTDNPVILHRIELMLHSKDKRIPKLKILTSKEEEHELYSSEHIKFIGRRKYWNKLCRDVGIYESVSPEDNLLTKQLDLFGNAEILIKRGATAMSTHKPSAPTQVLFKSGLITDNIFDWGCGKGRDTRFLQSKNYNVESYDKYNKPFPTPSQIDFSKVRTVLLNYVLNVIEDKQERLDLLSEISQRCLPGTLLLVSVRSKKEITEFANKSRWKHYNDGYITSRNTFQKGFDTNELKALLDPIVEHDKLENCGSYIYCYGKIL